MEHCTTVTKCVCVHKSNIRDNGNVENVDNDVLSAVQTSVISTQCRHYEVTTSSMKLRS